MKNRYTECEKKFIKDNYLKYSFKDLAKEFNKHFNADRSVSSFKEYCSKHGLKKTNGDGRFKNGHAAWNNGITKEEYLTHCTDKTRSILAKHKPPEHREHKKGDRIIRKIGRQIIPYIVTSEEKNVKFEKRLIPETRYIWEQYNGKVPEGYCIMHIDGDRMNNDISNLIMVKISDRSSIIGNDWFGNAEIFKTGISILKLQNALKNWGKYMED